MTSKIDDSVKNADIALKLHRLFDLQQSSVPIFASFHKVVRNLQKYRHLQMFFTYDVIDVTLRLTINDMVSKIF